MSIHPTALVSPKANIGQNVSIGAYSIIEDNVDIGDNSSIGNHNTICYGTKLGSNCKIYHNNSIGEVPQDLKYDGEDTRTLIGDNVVIREFVTVNRGTAAYGKTVIGDNVLLMACTHIAHDCIVGNNVIMANIATLGGHVEIGDWCNIGGGAMIHQFVKIGQQSLIGGGFSAKQDVPPFIIGAGIPLRFVGINKIGLERRGFSEENRALIKKAYRTYFKSKLNRRDAIQKIKNELPQTKEIIEIIDFIESSNRGII
ncbi:MAG: acyl-ACP--UDP-N-acetylglucosamine O-acyltransferase [Candidatus Neomarinimicrobiota bacterium]|nr:acyl-ACP--UDP-N-acetylglucosamine O-acyltransferase [Candidatus Neomarinimicrobiota bacterium]MEE3302264.1 acyl-ACP--UDP-N-acetylglucosamine O-acyltransferase [Candidatus Neomarinimicrobiota bacterium]